MNIKNGSIDAVDISSNALKVAKLNNEKLNANVNIFYNDLLKGLNFKYDVIISNPPYINDCEFVMDLVRNNEPNLALFSPDNGLYHYKEIIMESLDKLNEDGMIIFEIPDNKADLIKEFALKYYEEVRIYKDYNNQRRIMIIESRRMN